MDNIFLMQLQSTGVQALESAYIIATSKNIDTIISRYDFLLDRMSRLKQGQFNSQYSAGVQLIMDQYKKMYYDRPLQDYQIALLTNPSNFNIIDFYCISLLNAIKRYCTVQTGEINEMKKEAAKIKRKEKVIIEIRKTKVELQTKCSTSTNYSTVLADLENIEQSF